MSEIKRIKILHLFKKLNRGGAEMRTLELLRHCDRDKYEFHFCTTLDEEGTLDQEIISLGGIIHRCTLNLQFPFKFKRLLIEQKIDVVHSHLFLFSGYIAKLARQVNIKKRIAHFRSVSSGTKQTPRRIIQNKLFRYWLDKHATDVLGVCEGVLNSIIGLDWREDPRCKIVYDAIDPAPFMNLIKEDRLLVRKELGLPQDETLIIHVGRMVSAKNHLRLITVFKQLKELNKKTKLLLIGKAVDLTIFNRLQESVKEFGLENDVIMTGERMDIPKLLYASDLLLLPSIREGLPGVVLEALAAGIPVISSDLPGAREVSERIPYVSLISLEDEDSVWAKRINDFLERERYEIHHQEISNSLFESGFVVKRCVEQLGEIWST